MILALHALLLALPLLLLGRGAELTDPVVLVFLTLASALVLAESPARHERLRDARMTRLATGTGALLLLIFWTALVTRSSAWPIAGGLTMALGVALRGAAVRALGRGFTTEHSGHELRTAGVYRVLRHPSETGLLLIAAGAAGLLGSPLAAVLCLPLFALTLARLRLEERALIDEHGQQYREYAARVGGLLPRLRQRIGISTSVRHFAGSGS